MGSQRPVRGATTALERRTPRTSDIVGPQDHENIKTEHIAGSIDDCPPDQDALRRLAAWLMSG
jgi:hypothetical protein